MSKKGGLEQGDQLHLKLFKSAKRASRCRMQTGRGSSLGELLIKAEDYPLRGSGNHVDTQIRAELSWHLGMCLFHNPRVLPLQVPLVPDRHPPHPQLQGPQQCISHPWVGERKKLFS